MKRVICFLLAVFLCVSLGACGENGLDKPAGPPEPTEWVISTEYISQRVLEFKESEELKFL